MSGDNSERRPPETEPTGGDETLKFSTPPEQGGDGLDFDIDVDVDESFSVDLDASLSRSSSSSLSSSSSSSRAPHPTRVPAPPPIRRKSGTMGARYKAARPAPPPPRHRGSTSNSGLFSLPPNPEAENTKDKSYDAPISFVPAREQEDLSEVFNSDNPLAYGVEIGADEIPETDLQPGYDPWADVEEDEQGQTLENSGQWDLANFSGVDASSDVEMMLEPDNPTRIFPEQMSVEQVPVEQAPVEQGSIEQGSIPGMEDLADLGFQVRSLEEHDVQEKIGSVDDPLSDSMESFSFSGDEDPFEGLEEIFDAPHSLSPGPFLSPTPPPEDFVAPGSPVSLPNNTETETMLSADGDVTRFPSGESGEDRHAIALSSPILDPESYDAISASVNAVFGDASTNSRETIEHSVHNAMTHPHFGEASDVQHDIEASVSLTGRAPEEISVDLIQIQEEMESSGDISAFPVLERPEPASSLQKSSHTSLSGEPAPPSSDGEAVDLADPMLRIMRAQIEEDVDSSLDESHGPLEEEGHAPSSVRSRRVKRAAASLGRSSRSQQSAQRSPSRPEAASKVPAKPVSRSGFSAERSKERVSVDSGSFGILKKTQSNPSRARRSSPSLAVPGQNKSRGRQLLDRARILRKGGRFKEAHKLLVEVLRKNPSNSQLRQLVALNKRAIQKQALKGLGNLDVMPTLAIPASKMMELGLDSRSAYLLSQIDGMSTFRDLLELSPMSKDETVELLSRFLQKKIIKV